MNPTLLPTRVLRGAVLALLVVSFLGPWGFSSDGVPPPEWCRAPHLLLTSERCVRLVPGAEILFTGAQVVVSAPAALASGWIRPADLLRNLIFVALIALLLLPFLATLAWMLNPQESDLRRFHTIAWLAALAPAFLIAITDHRQRPGQLWGVWLYVALAVIVLALDWLGPRLKRSSFQNATGGSPDRRLPSDGG